MTDKARKLVLVEVATIARHSSFELCQPLLLIHSADVAQALALAAFALMRTRSAAAVTLYDFDK